MSEPKKRRPPREKDPPQPPPSNPNNDPEIEEEVPVGDEPVDPRERIKLRRGRAILRGWPRD